MKNILSYFIMTLIIVGSVSAQDSVLSFNLSQFTVNLLSEGQQNGKVDVLIDATPEMLKKCAPDGTIPMATNAFLVQMDGKNILIDTGYGEKLLDNLKKYNLTPEQIDMLLITHMHGDHIGGMLKDGAVVFPNAEVYLAQREHDYWIGDQVNNDQARKVIEVYKSKLHLFKPVEIVDKGGELFPGVRGIAAYGHTPGHTAFMIEKNGTQVLVWGDLTHAMAVQMPYPQIAVKYDVDPKQAIASRAKILQYVAWNHIPVAGMHIPYPAMGTLNPGAEGGYVFMPIE